MNDTDLELRLAGLMTDAGGRTIDTGRAWRELQVLRARSSRNRRNALAVAAVALAVAVAGTVPTLAAHRSAAPSPRPSSAASAVPRSYPGAVAARIPMSGVGEVVQDGPRAWAVRAVSTTPPGSYQLVSIDLRTDQVVLRKDLGTAPAVVAAGGGGLWLTTSLGAPHAQIVRLDPATGRVIANLRLPVAKCTSLTYSFGSLWANCDVNGPTATDFLRINPATGRVTWQTGPVRGQVGYMAVAPHAIWYLNLYSTISGFVGIGGRVHPVTVNDPSYPVSFLNNIDSLVYGQGFVWALTTDESVAKIDPATGRMVRIYTYRSYDPNYAGGLDFLVVGHGSLWFLSDGYPLSGVLRVSIATGRPIGLVPGIPSGACGQPCSQIYSSQSAIWVPTATQVIRIDPGRMPG